jgi:hypothetical protein
LVRKPAELTGTRREQLCTWGEPTRPGVGGLSRKRYTQYVEHNRKGGLREQDETGRGAIMEEVLCASMALKSTKWPAEPPHTNRASRVL